MGLLYIEKMGKLPMKMEISCADDIMLHKNKRGKKEYGENGNAGKYAGNVLYFIKQRLGVGCLCGKTYTFD